MRDNAAIIVNTERLTSKVDSAVIKHVCFNSELDGNLGNVRQQRYRYSYGETSVSKS